MLLTHVIAGYDCIDCHFNIFSAGFSSSSYFFVSCKMKMNSGLAACVASCLIVSLDAGYVSHKTQPQPQCHTEYETVTSYEQQCTTIYEDDVRKTNMKMPCVVG